MFELTKIEVEILRSQIGTSSWGGTRYVPMVFTEQGVAQLSSVLNSQRAIEVNIRIIRTFIKMREMLVTHKDLLLEMEKIRNQVSGHENQLELIFEYLNQFEKAKQIDLEQKNRKKIGYNPKVKK